jgi:MFS family permease
MALSGRSLVGAMCAGQVGNLLPHVVVPAVMAGHLIPQWGLSASQAGLMASAFAIGYMLAVPVLTALTDRIDARLILLVGSAVSGLATLAFGLLADGLWSATLIWATAGIGFAGAYMPGLKALVDRLPPGDSSRSVTLYTATFSFGVGLSFLIAQIAADTLGWRLAFYITGLGPLAMIVACLGMAVVKPKPSARRLLDFMSVFRNRPAMGFILGYGAHCFELYALRTWIVAFWSYVAARNGGSALMEPMTVSVVAASARHAVEHRRQRGRHPVRRHRAIVLFMCVADARRIDRGGNERGAGTALGARADLLDCDPRRFRGADLGHDAERRAGVSRRDHGHTLHGGLRPLGGWSVGHRHRSRRRRGHAKRERVAARLPRDGRGRADRANRDLVVIASQARIATLIAMPLPRRRILRPG